MINKNTDTNENRNKTDVAAMLLMNMFEFIFYKDNAAMLLKKNRFTEEG